MRPRGWSDDVQKVSRQGRRLHQSRVATLRKKRKSMRYKTNLSQRGQADTATYRLAQGLGIFSILLGMTELICGRWLSRSLGLDGKGGVVRLYGGREILTGVAILASKDPTPWIWGRVAGDALDIGTLAYGYTRDTDDV